MSGWYRIPKGEGWRLMRIGDGMIESLGSRTNEGHAIHGEWGEPDRYGVYEPTFTVDYTDLTPRPILFDGEEERLAAAISPHAVSSRNGWTPEGLARAIMERLRNG